MITVCVCFVLCAMSSYMGRNTSLQKGNNSLQGPKDSLQNTKHRNNPVFLWAMTSESSCKTVPFVDQDSKTFRFASVRV